MKWVRAGALVLLAAAFCLTFLVDPWQNELVSDVPLYRAYADVFLDGALPYRDVGFEYPPLAAPLIALPGLVSLDPETYRYAFAVLTFALAAGVLLATGRLAALGPRARVGRPRVRSRWRRSRRERCCERISTWRRSSASSRASRRWLPPARASASSSSGWAARSSCSRSPPRPWRRRGSSDEGGAAKRSPGWRSPRSWRASRWPPPWRSPPTAAGEAVEYHVERPVQIESLPASVLNGIEAAGGEAPEPVHSHRSDGLEHPAADAITAGFIGLMCAALVALTLAARRTDDVRGLGLAGLASAAAFASFGKVLSPQFMLWLVPLAAVAFAWGMYALGVVTAAAIGTTLVWFPDRYFDLVAREDTPLIAVAARNGLLLLMLALVAWEVRRLVRESREPARSTPQVRQVALQSTQH